MAIAHAAVGFIGDLDDPWVGAIADAIPAHFRVERLQCIGDVPEEPFGAQSIPRLIVLHRHRLSARDRARIKLWKEESETEITPAVVLCVSPYVRYEGTEGVLGLVDQVVPEGTAADILPGRIVRLVEGAAARDGRRNGVSFAIEVSGKNENLCRTVVEVCVGAGYRAVAIDDLLAGDLAKMRPQPSSSERTLTIWEVPVLEAGWPEVLERRALETGPLIGLLGFADRATVSQAKAKGAVACLDLPFELEDLLDCVERAAELRAPEHWPLPPRAEPPHQLPPRPRRRAASRESSSVVRPWRE